MRIILLILIFIITSCDDKDVYECTLGYDCDGNCVNP